MNFQATSRAHALYPFWNAPPTQPLLQPTPLILLGRSHWHLHPQAQFLIVLGMDHQYPQLVFLILPGVNHSATPMHILIILGMNHRIWPLACILSVSCSVAATRYPPLLPLLVFLGMLGSALSCTRATSSCPVHWPVSHHSEEDQQDLCLTLSFEWLSAMAREKDLESAGSYGWHLDVMSSCSAAKLCPTLCNPMDSTHQAPLSMEVPRQEYWGGLPFPSLGDLLEPGIEPTSPALSGGFFTTEPPGKPPFSSLATYKMTFLYTEERMLEDSGL